MKKSVIFVIVAILIIILSLFFLKYNQKDSLKLINTEITQPETKVNSLGNLCLGESECINFCQNNFERCESYCLENSENNLCKIISPQEKLAPEINQKIKIPVLKNLGVNIDDLDIKTNLAGDITFDKKLLFEDEIIKNDRPFFEFGSIAHVKNNPKPSIEYWFFVKPKTEILAPSDGKVNIFFIDHTKDWGVNILLEGSDYTVSIEHLLNLKVKDGDEVKAGDVLGEAVPKFGVGFTELAVWTGGSQVIKYCPFNFLEESLKPIYNEKLNKLVEDWEESQGKNVYDEEKWVSPGCLHDEIIEK